MKKEIKDYLHFYMGSDLNFKITKIETGLITIDKMTSLSEDCVCFSDSPDIYFDDVSFNETSCKPILRQLNDITKEEKEVASKLCGVVNLFNNKNKDEKFNYVKHEAEHIAYLLKQGFDVFDLIEDGLAVDEKTLTEQKV